MANVIKIMTLPGFRVHLFMYIHFALDSGAFFCYYITSIMNDGTSGMA